MVKSGMAVMQKKNKEQHQEVIKILRTADGSRDKSQLEKAYDVLIEFTREVALVRRQGMCLLNKGQYLAWQKYENGIESRKKRLRMWDADVLDRNVFSTTEDGVQVVVVKKSTEVDVEDTERSSFYVKEERLKIGKSSARDILADDNAPEMFLGRSGSALLGNMAAASNKVGDIDEEDKDGGEESSGDDASMTGASCDDDDKEDVSGGKPKSITASSLKPAEATPLRQAPKAAGGSRSVTPRAGEKRPVPKASPEPVTSLPQVPDTKRPKPKDFWDTKKAFKLVVKTKADGFKVLCPPLLR